MIQNMYIVSKRIYTNGPTIIYDNIIPYLWYNIIIIYLKNTKL